MKFKILGIISLSFLFLILGSSVAFAQNSPEQIAAKHGITFPIAELGGCTDYASRRTFCEDPVNSSQCIEFAKKKGFYKEKGIQEQSSLMTSAKTQLGCDSESSCREFCGNQANWEKCGEFAKKHRITGGHTEDPKKAEILEKAKVELGCTSYETCMSFCHQEGNRQKCSDFAKVVGLRGGEAHAGPGGCTSEETCKALCSNPNNYEICSKFTSASGGSFHGPGGCNSTESCRLYCEQRPQECGNAQGLTGGLNYYDNTEMCNKTPSCSWVNGTCQCSNNGETPSCSWVNGTCQCSNNGGAGLIDYEEYCKKYPDKCLQKGENAQYTPY